MKRRKEVWEALHPVEIQVGKVFPPEIGYGKPPPQDKAFAASTSEVTGENVRSIQRHLARAEAIGDDLPRVAGTSPEDSSNDSNDSNDSIIPNVESMSISAESLGQGAAPRACCRHQKLY